MTGLTEGEMIRALYDIEGVKRVKRKYWRCVDEKKMDELEDCFTDDAIADYATLPPIEGRDAIIEFLKQGIAREDQDIISIHQGFNPEIEITGDTTARGRWRLYNYLHFGKARTSVRTWSFYDDEYLKVDGEWKIKYTKTTRTVSETTTTT